MRWMHLLIFQILKVLGSKSQLELERLSVCYPKKMELYSKETFKIKN